MSAPSDIIRAQLVDHIVRSWSGSHVIRGTRGPPGRGVPPGGAEGQVLVKLSAADFDTGWATASVSPSGDIQLDFSDPDDSGFIGH
jgi:hypothetical protein